MKFHTTGSVAKLLQVAPRTVSKWMDSGALKGFRLPLSHDRRIPQANLVEFCREHGMPHEIAQTTVLIVTQDSMLLDAVKSFVGVEYRIVGAGSEFEAGKNAEAANLVMVDLALGDGVAKSILKSFGIVAAIVPDNMPVPSHFPWIVHKSAEEVVKSISMCMGGEK